MNIEVFSATRLSAKKRQWHGWFAWRPILVETPEGSMRLIWLEKIERYWDGSLEHGNWTYRIP